MTISSYYNFAKLFSFNATIMGVLGGRGLGKTWGSKEKGIKDAIKSIKINTRTVEGEGKRKSKTVHEVNASIDQFIYLRRYKEELSLARATFFADIEWRFPEWDFRLQGWEAQASHRKYASVDRGRPWATIGYFVALSVAQNYKSVQFPYVKTIIFDEFIAERGVQYLPDESAKLINFLNTVDRGKDKTRMLLLANSVSITNPYFIHYQVDVDTIDKDGFIKMARDRDTGVYYMLWHFPQAEDYQQEFLQTKYGKFIAATDPEYTAYAVGNKFKDANKNLIESKPYTAKYMMTLETKMAVFSIWYDIKSGLYYCQTARPAGDEDLVTLIPERVSEDKRLAVFTDKSMGRLRSAYRHGRMRFDRASTRNGFVEIFKRT